LFAPEVFMPFFVYLGKLKVLCSCGVRVVPDPALPMETVLHECADCCILQGLPPDKETPEPNAVADTSATSPCRPAGVTPGLTVTFGNPGDRGRLLKG
jgi:hypothetical protein